MSPPSRLVEGQASELTRRLLQAGLSERPTAGVTRRVLVLAVAIPTATKASLAAGGAVAAVKWLGVGFLAGGVAIAGTKGLSFLSSAPAALRTERAARASASHDDSGGASAIRPGLHPRTLPERRRIADSAPPQPAAEARLTRERTGGGGAAVLTGGAQAAASRAASRVPAAVSPSAAVPGSPSEALSAVPVQSTLGAEIAWIDRARLALSAGQPATALTTLEQYRQRYPRGRFGPEATALEVEARLLGGDGAGARALAAHFLARHPTSPLAERVRSLTNP